MSDASAQPTAHPTFGQALRLWLKIGLLSFGGPAAQIAMLHDEAVEKRKWVAEERFQHALRFCSFCPGPEAQQLATCCGWYLHGTWGGICAGALFVLPAAVLLWALSWMYAAFGSVPWVNACFHGLKAAVIALVAAAVVKLARKSLKGWGAYAIALLAFGFLEFKTPFPLVVAAAALLGWGINCFAPRFMPVSLAKDPPLPEHPTGIGAFARTLAAGLALWALPVALAWAFLGAGHLLTQQGLFFSKAACVTFGGAYAVLPYVAHHAAEAHWTTQAQTMDGLALAETTPGPLIIVLEFFGFMGGWRQPGAWPPIVTATLCAAMTVWTTFVPSTFFALLGAPHLEKVRGIKWLTGALAGVSAAVVGVVLSLAAWMLWESLWPGRGPTDWFILLATPAAFALLQWRKWGMVPVLLLCGAAGWGWWMAMG